MMTTTLLVWHPTTIISSNTDVVSAHNKMTRDGLTTTAEFIEVCNWDVRSIIGFFVSCPSNDSADDCTHATSYTKSMSVVFKQDELSS